MERRDLLDELKSSFEFADAILGLAEDNEPISCLAYAVAEKLGQLISELERENKQYVVRKEDVTPEMLKVFMREYKYDRE